MSKANDNVLKLNNLISVLDYGAVPYSSVATAAAGVDSAAAFQAALDAAATAPGATLVYVPKGRYRIGSTLTVTGAASGFVGDSLSASWLVGTSTSGEIIRFNQDQPTLRDITISAGGSRASAAYSVTTPGVRVEMTDEPFANATRTRNVDFYRLQVSSQPGSGVYLVGTVTGQIQTSIFSSNKGHGIHLAEEIIARTNFADVPGLCEITTNNFFSNGGHAIYSQGPNSYSSPSVRVGVINNEIGGNALDAAVRGYTAEVYMRGAQFTLSRNVFKPNTGNTTMEGWFVSGVGIYIENNRYIRCVRAGTVSSHDTLESDCVVVDGVHMVEHPGSYDPLVLVRTEGTVRPNQVTVRNWSGGTVVRPVGTDASIGVAGASLVPGLTTGSSVCVYPTTDYTINNTVTFSDVPGFSVAVKAGTRVYVQAVVEYSGDDTADIAVRLIGPPGSTVRYGSPSSIKIDIGGTVIVQGSGDTSTVMTFGATSGSRRLVTLYGYCDNPTTTGSMRIQVRQASAVVANTTVHNGLSHMIAYHTPLPG